MVCGDSAVMCALVWSNTCAVKANVWCLYCLHDTSWNTNRYNSRHMWVWIGLHKYTFSKFMLLLWKWNSLIGGTYYPFCPSRARGSGKWVVVRSTTKIYIQVVSKNSNILVWFANWYTWRQFWPGILLYKFTKFLFIGLLLFTVCDSRHSWEFSKLMLLLLPKWRGYFPNLELWGCLLEVKVMVHVYGFCFHCLVTVNIQSQLP